MQETSGETEGSWLPVCVLGWEGGREELRVEEEQGGGEKFSCSALSSIYIALSKATTQQLQPN